MDHSFFDGFARSYQGRWLSKQLLGLAMLVLVATLLNGCGPAVSNVRLKVNSEPEGAHLVYCLTSAEQQEAPEWIYLGNTPYSGIRRFDEEQLTESSKISLKVMRAGYFDQVKEWDGSAFLEEAEASGQIFWTPRLIEQHGN